MLAKAVPNRGVRRRGTAPFHAQVHYICRKAVRVVLRGLSGRWTDAAWQMSAAAALAPGLRRPDYHVVLSWPHTERPSDDDMITAARMVIDEIGASAHQSVIALHRDRTNPHAHVLVNRVHPTTGQRLSLSHDYARLEHACRLVEHRMGWAADRGRFDVVVTDGGVTLTPKPPNFWTRRAAARARGLRPDGIANRAHERRTGVPSLRDLLDRPVQDRLRTILDRATGWPDMHDAMARTGLRYMPNARGARIVRPVDGAWMPAGHLGSACTRRVMEARLGPWVPRSGPMVALEVGAGEPSYPHDLKTLVSIQRSEAAVREKMRGDRKTLWDELGHQRRRIETALGTSRSPFAQAVRHVLRHSEREARTDLDARHRALGALRSPVISEGLALLSGWFERRRYRMVARMPLDHGANGPVQPDASPDHTTGRRAWVLNDRQIPNSLPATVQAHVQRNPDTLRSAGGHAILFGHRNLQGDLVGFDYFDPARDVQMLLPGGRHGLCSLGPANARQVVLVPDAPTALAVMTALGGTARIHIADPRMPDSEVDALQAPCGGRGVSVAVTSICTPDHAGWLTALIPGTRTIRIEAARAGPAGASSRDVDGRESSPGFCAGGR